MMRRIVILCAFVVAMLSAGCGPVASESTGETTGAETDKPAASVLLPSFNLAKIPDADLSPDGFGKPVSEAGAAYRIVKPGARRDIAIDAWWDADSPRPPEGAKYVLDVSYKDTITDPATFYSNGGIGRYNKMSPVHRFGGAGDGAWKTANIPLSWSYLIRLSDRPEKTRLGILTPGELPVSDMTLRVATPQDEARLNAETRAWIARAQAVKRTEVKLTYPAPDKKYSPNIPIAVAFPTDPMIPLMPNVAPQPDGIGAAVAVRMCLNELEPGAFGVYAPGDALREVDYRISTLKRDDGKTLKADIIRRTAEYAVLGMKGKYRIFPQRLWPAFAVDIPVRHTQWFYFNIRTKRGETLPGVYRGTITITSANAKPATLPVVVTVLDIDLLTMEEAGLTSGGCVTGFLPLHDFDFAVDYNQNSFQIWFAGAQPKMTMKDGSLKIDFSFFDNYMKAAKKRGVVNVVWFLGGNPYGWPDTMTIIRDLMRIDLTGDKNMAARVAWGHKQASEKFRNSVVPEARDRFKSWVRQVMAHSKKADWPEVILTPFDEPAKWTQGPYRKNGNFKTIIGTGEWIKPFFKDMCAMIHAAAPGTRIYASIHHNHPGNGPHNNEGICFLKDIDVFCTNAIHEDPLLGDKVRAADKMFWQYSGTSSGGKPQRALYTFGWYFAAFDSRGSLVWAYNWGGWFDNTGGSNWTYAHHTPYDTIPEPFFEGLREAWDDRRLIETYKKTFAGDPDAMKLLKDILNEAKESRTLGGRDTVNDFWADVDNIKKITKWENLLLDKLASHKK